MERVSQLPIVLKDSQGYLVEVSPMWKPHRPTSREAVRSRSLNAARECRAAILVVIASFPHVRVSCDDT